MGLFTRAELLSVTANEIAVFVRNGRGIKLKLGAGGVFLSYLICHSVAEFYEGLQNAELHVNGLGQGAIAPGVDAEIPSLVQNTSRLIAHLWAGEGLLHIAQLV